ncbi:MAG: adventurous gliding motility lipoprotein CglC [Deltaproteobacteria bacterium]|nr:adventurous gliding motility lipoprotein CglC [Deltaproteobacteria bacterium]
MTPRLSLLVLPLLLVVSAGCGKTDLGTPCTLVQPTVGGEPEPFDPPSEANDYLSTGQAGCEDFTCIDTAGDGEDGYCSRRCAEDAQCKGGVDKTLICRELVLDEAFLTELRQRLGDEEFFRVFGDIQNARYCARP